MRANDTCSVDDCERPIKSRGWCHTHYLRWHKHGDPLTRKTMKIEGPCSVHGCDRAARTRGWCTKHYDRWWRTKTTELVPKGKPVCSVGNCGNLARARGWCMTHYQRWHLNGSMELTRPRIIHPCLAEDCDDPAESRGWCPEHFETFRGTVDLKSRFCSVEGCDLKVKAHGWCVKHYSRWKTHGNLHTVLKRADGQLMEELLAAVRDDPDDCRTAGYTEPYVNFEGSRRSMAHVALILSGKGDRRDEGLEACHSCGNGHDGCFTPRHLRWDTHAGNMKDTYAHRTNSQKMHESQIQVIKTSPLRTSVLCAAFGLDRSTVKGIRAGKLWPHVEV